MLPTRVIHRSLTTTISRIRGQLVLQAMALTGVAFLVVFAYLPMFGIIIAFKDYKIVSGFLGSPWAGFKHFAAAFNDDRFFMAFKNTIILSFLNTIFVFPAPIFFALVLNELPFRRLKKISQTCSYLPHFISYVVVATLWLTFLDPRGPINSLLVALGIARDAIEFWAEPNLFRPLAVVVTMWQQTGWNAIIFFAAMAGINPELYESAIIDGAGRIRRMVSITLPSIKGTIVILFILRFSNLFRGNFEQSYLLGNIFNKEKSYVLEYFTLDVGLNLMRYSFATAVNLFQSILSLTLLLMINRISKRTTHVGLL